MLKQILQNQEFKELEFEASCFAPKHGHVPPASPISLTRKLKRKGWEDSRMRDKRE